MPRRKTGLKRGYPVQVDYGKSEDEFISRESWERNESKSGFIRKRGLPANWRERLKILRIKQKGIPGIYTPRKDDDKPGGTD